MMKMTVPPGGEATCRDGHHDAGDQAEHNQPPPHPAIGGRLLESTSAVASLVAG